jgi:hypothetical protein
MHAMSDLCRVDTVVVRILVVSCLNVAKAPAVRFMLLPRSQLGKLLTLV